MLIAQKNYTNQIHQQNMRNNIHMNSNEKQQYFLLVKLVIQTNKA